MRHKKAGRKLNRTWEHRKAMFRTMSRSLLVHERIRTTVPKAKELSQFMDRLINLTKRNDLHSRRLAFKVLENHKLVELLFAEVGPRFADVPGGYTRVIKLGLPRRGDAAPMAMIELTRLKTPVETPKKAETADSSDETVTKAEKPAKKAQTAKPKTAVKKAAEKEQKVVKPKAKKADAESTDAKPKKAARPKAKAKEDSKEKAE